MQGECGALHHEIRNIYEAKNIDFVVENIARFGAKNIDFQYR